MPPKASSPTTPTKADRPPRRATAQATLAGAPPGARTKCVAEARSAASGATRSTSASPMASTSSGRLTPGTTSPARDLRVFRDRSDAPGLVGRQRSANLLDKLVGRNRELPQDVQGK